MRSIELIELLEDDESIIKIIKDDCPSRTKVPYIYTKQYASACTSQKTRRLVVLPTKEVGPIEL
jgi:hypothetical protein